MTSVLKLRNLCKSFGALKVTDNVSIELAAGECHALIGPNGAGKSTLIHQISGLMKADSGVIEFEGRDVSALSLAQRAQAGLARTYQITAVISEFSVLENVALAAQATDGSSMRFFGIARNEKILNDRAFETLTMLNMTDRALVKAAELSHGERRLLEIAMAIAAKPHAVLLDEPTAGLGKGESQDLTEVLRALKARTPMLLVEHDMEAVFALADRVSVLVYGKIITTGTPEQVRNDPAARAAYLGED